MPQRSSPEHWQVILAALGGTLLGMALLFAAEKVGERLRQEQSTLDGSPELVLELLNEQWQPYTAPVAFSYRARCADVIDYRSYATTELHGGRTTIPIVCPARTITELQITLDPADPTCFTPAVIGRNVIEGTTLRYRIACESPVRR